MLKKKSNIKVSKLNHIAIVALKLSHNKKKGKKGYELPP